MADYEERLIDSLMRWIMKLSNVELQSPWDQDTLVMAMVEVLCLVDYDHFYPLANGNPPQPTTIASVVTLFYRNKLRINKKIKLPSQELTDQCLISLFEIVFSLALLVKKEEFLRKVLELDIADQETLMDFVNRQIDEQNEQTEPPLLDLTSTTREPVREQEDRTSRGTRQLLDELQLKEAECRIYKERSEQYEQRCRQLEYNYTTLKQEFHRLNEQVSIAHSERMDLTIDLGLTGSHLSYRQISDRCRQMLANYHTRVQELERQLEKRNNDIQQRNQQLDRLHKQLFGEASQQANENSVTLQDYQRMQLSYEQQLEQLQLTLRSLNETLNEKQESIQKMLGINTSLEMEVSELKDSLIKNQQSLDRYRQLKKLTKSFFREVETHFKV